MNEINLDESMYETLDELEKSGVEEVEELDEAEEIDEDAPQDPPETPEAPDEAIEPEADEVPEVEAPAVEDIEPRLNLAPTTWTAEAKANYKDLPAWAKKEVHKREEDVLKGISSLKEQSKYGERMQHAVAPYQALLAQKGVDAEGAVKGMLNTLYTLEAAQPQRRAQLIRDLATQYGVDLQAVSAPVDPDAAKFNQFVQPLTQQIQQLQQVINQQRNSSHEQQLSEANNAINAFVNELDENGRQKHPYFESVSDFMTPLLESGRATTLNEAYEIAVWANPETRALIQSEQTKNSEAERQRLAKQKADKARKANKLNLDKRGSQETSSPKPTGSMVDTLNETYERLNAQN